ncbi:MAG: hypothetical protein AVDCRST_MAG30-4521 [uncultured Solirubrobacteraceae bacterium]|uniref:Glycosyltransferase 2-like domain-containing protein n=1 Tax=uncultured Solirubrobacteraceae bacterium TaxID=1162706 RepID=A0A6J4U2Q4_9ACTN|nr:MAG: hypothetical protein AVDCRST_MAG30-4521 [uncultured Solirubrobacteraceae bacterium]
MSDWPLVTINILSYNKRDYVDETLTKLKTALDYPPESLELMVVDNASTDGTVEMLAERHPEVRVIETGANLGAPALNWGFERGRGDYFLVLDDDCYIEGSALKDAIGAAREHDADLISFAVISGVDPTYRFDRDYRTGLLGFWGCAFIVSRRLIEREGGYDPDLFIWGNEAELTMRVLDAGMRHVYLPSVVAVHMKGRPDDVQPTMSRLMNLRHFTHAVVKLFPVRDAVPVLAVLLFRTLAGGIARGELGGSLAGFARGARTGWRARRPIRREVAGLYRRNFPEFAHPALFEPRVRRLREPAAAGSDYNALRRRYWARRPDLYPDDFATLSV